MNHSKEMTKKSSSDQYSANIGQYDKNVTVSYYIIAIDTLTNSMQSNTLTFIVKSPEPIITIENPESNSVIYDKTPTIKLQYYDVVGINPSNIVLKLDNIDITNNATITTEGIIYIPNIELILGSHAVSISVTDNLNNNAIKSWWFTIVHSDTTIENEIGEINPDDIKEIIFDLGKANQIGIDSIYINTNKKLIKTNLLITKLLNIPSMITEPKITDISVEIIGGGYLDIYTKNIFIYSYLEILFTSNGSKVKETDIDSIMINFKIEKSWINKNNIDKKNVKFLRYKDDYWQQLTTSYTNEDNTYVYYNALTKGFSIFSITGIEEKIAEKQSEGINWLLIIGGIIGTIIIIIALLFKTGYLYIEKSQQQYYVGDEETLRTTNEKLNKKIKKIENKIDKLKMK